MANSAAAFDPDPLGADAMNLNAGLSPAMAALPIPAAWSGAPARAKAPAAGKFTYELEPPAPIPAPDAAPAAAAPGGNFTYEKEDAPGQTLGDAVNSLTTGLNKGALTRLPGLPMDTALDVGQIAQAGAGVLYHELTKGPETAPYKDVPDYLKPRTREDLAKIAGTSEWWEDRYRNNGLGPVIDPTGAADTPLNRGLHTFGTNVAPGMVGGTFSGGARTVARTVLGAVGGSAAGAFAQEYAPDSPVLQTGAAILGGAAGGKVADVRAGGGPKVAVTRPPKPAAATGGYTADDILKAPVPEQFRTGMSLL